MILSLLLKIIRLFKKKDRTYLLRANSYYAGIATEKLAVKYLKKQNYKILATNFKTKVGEIDIIATKNNALVAIEVKYRKNETALPYSITLQKQKRVARALEMYCKRYKQYGNSKLRFDVILVNYELKIKHMENAWLLS
jgi:putative endonuclease